MANSMTLEESIAAQRSVEIPGSNSGVAGSHRPQGTSPSKSDKKSSKSEEV